ncbi:MAG TPA: hypothetical protein VNW99_13910 [Cytophagaceae bacterium]|jgi:hypothetical protein|nr:hypothetical protein [Cytophagaceae bacterium]
MKKKETRIMDLSKAWEKYKQDSNPEQNDQKVVSGFSNIDSCEVVVHNNRKYFRRKKKAS